MIDTSRRFRLVPVGQSTPDAVTVGIEPNEASGVKAAVWWDSTGDIDADEAEYDDVERALEAAEAARALHGFSEIVVVLSQPDLWQGQWGELVRPPIAREPIGDVSATDLSSAETFELAAAIEGERDA